MAPHPRFTHDTQGKTLVQRSFNLRGSREYCGMTRRYSTTCLRHSAQLRGAAPRRRFPTASVAGEVNWKVLWYPCVADMGSVEVGSGQSPIDRAFKFGTRALARKRSAFPQETRVSHHSAPKAIHSCEQLLGRRSVSNMARHSFLDPLELLPIPAVCL